MAYNVGHCTTVPNNKSMMFGSQLYIYNYRVLLFPTLYISGSGGDGR
jgi:hypothetical protein